MVVNDVAADEPTLTGLLADSVAFPRARIVDPDRLSLGEHGRVALQLKTRWRDGTVDLLFTPEQFVARLAALVSRPGKNLVRDHGVLPPNARDRADYSGHRAGSPSGRRGRRRATRGPERAFAAESQNGPVPALP